LILVLYIRLSPRLSFCLYGHAAYRDLYSFPTRRSSDLCALAMLLISSIMLTVLPTPAPPNRPTLPPLANGHIRSMTLMPVSSSSVAGDWSSYDGAARWISHVSAACTSPASSIGRPSTSMMRPRVPGPTGTEMARLVLVATRLPFR